MSDYQFYFHLLKNMVQSMYFQEFKYSITHVMIFETNRYNRNISAVLIIVRKYLSFSQPYKRLIINTEWIVYKVLYTGQGVYLSTAGRPFAY